MNNKNYPLYKTEEFKNFNHMFLRLAERNGEKPAFMYKDKNKTVEISYIRLAKEISFVLKGYEKNNLKNAHIGCMGRNSYFYALCYIATLCSSNVFVPVDKDLAEDSMVNLINHSETKVLFLDTKYEEKVLSNMDKMPNLEKVIVFGKSENFESFSDFGEETDDWATVLRNDNKDIDVLKCLIYTSGTTGNPKGVMLSEKNILKDAYFGTCVCPVKTRCVSILPYHHTYEETCGILVSLMCDATICVNTNLTHVLSDLNYYKPDYMVIVPAVAELFYKSIIKNVKAKGKGKTFETGLKISGILMKLGIDVRRKLFKDIHSAFGGNLTKIYCGGAPINPDTCRFFEKIGIMFICGYGITECSPLVSGNRDKFNNPETVGVPLSCLELEIRDKTEDGTGEICVKGDNVMMGYYKNPDATNDAIKDGWFYTGDYGYLNEKGQLVISGRKKNIIVLSNGKNIYPEEIEEKLKDIAEIKEIVIRGDEDEKGNIRGLIAEIFLDEECSLTKEDISLKIKENQENLPAYKKVARVILRSTPFEKTTTKKIKR